MTASLTSDSAVVGSETDASIEITSDLTFKEDDVVTITSNLITEASDFEFTKANDSITIQGYSQPLNAKIQNPWNMIQVQMQIKIERNGAEIANGEMTYEASEMT